MSAAAVESQEDRPENVATPDAVWRRFAVSSVVGAVWISWIGFTLGAYRQVFFEQTLSVWAASLAIFIASLFEPGRSSLSWGRRWPLLIPTVFLGLGFVLPPDHEGYQVAWVVLTVLVVVFGIRQFLGVMLSVLSHDYARLGSTRQRLTVGGIVLGIGIASALIGWQNQRFLTCYDFAVSGNAQPINCSAEPAGFQSQIK